MIADFAIHDPVRPKGAEPNPHIHILVPIRPLKEDGTWGIKEKKISVMDEQGNPVLDKNGKQAYRAVSVSYTHLTIYTKLKATVLGKIRREDFIGTKD